MSRWFRHYAGMMRDDKLVSAAIKSEQSVERVVWIWGAILESAAEIDKGGKYELDIAEAAYFLRASEGDVSSIIAALSALGRVRRGSVVKWGDRQFQSDKSKNRVAAFRKRQQEKGVHDSPGNGIKNSELTHVTVTLRKRHRNAPETETETETDKNPLTPLRGDLPEWVPVSDWLAFRDMRKTIKKPMTDRAVELALAKLADLKKAGHDPAIILQQSTLNCWQDIYPPKNPPPSSHRGIGI